MSSLWVPEGADEPMLTKKVIGYREWDDEDGLGAIGVSAQWGRGVNVARCNSAAMILARPRPMGAEDAEEQHVSPDHDCGCGLYGLHELPEETMGPGPWPYWKITGAIAAWGKMEVHPNGFRAQFAEIIALAVNPRWPLNWVTEVEQIAANYGVPAVDMDDLAEFASNYGAPVPSELIPERKVSEQKKAKAANPAGFIYGGVRVPSPGGMGLVQQAQNQFWQASNTRLFLADS